MKPMDIAMAMQEADSRDESIAILRAERSGFLIRFLMKISERRNKICHFCETDENVKYVVETFDPTIDAHKKVHVCCCNMCLIKFEKGKHKS